MGRWTSSLSYTFRLTKLQVRFNLDNTLNDDLLRSVGDAQAIYGIEWIKLNADMKSLVVEYDATRLRPPEVEAALRKHGLAVHRA